MTTHELVFNTGVSSDEARVLTKRRDATASKDEVPDKRRDWSRFAFRNRLRSVMYSMVKNESTSERGNGIAPN